MVSPDFTVFDMKRVAKQATLTDSRAIPFVKLYIGEYYR